MNILILGAGKIGRNLAKGIGRGKITLIEEDQEKAEKVALDGNWTVIIGDCRDPNVLAEAGIENADIVVAATSSDETNFLSAVYAKSQKVPKVIAIMSKIEFTWVLNRLDIEAILPEMITADDISMMIKMPLLYDIVKNDTFEYSLFEFKVGKNYEGKKISDLLKSNGGAEKVIAFYRDKEFIWPIDEEESLIIDDTLLILVKTEYFDELVKKFKV